MTRQANWIQQFLLMGILQDNKSECKQIEWSWNGSTLAILLKSAQILLWDPISKVKELETGIRSLDSIEWSLDNEYVQNSLNF